MCFVLLDIEHDVQPNPLKYVLILCLESQQSFKGGGEVEEEEVEVHVFCILKETSAYILSMVKVSMETLGWGGMHVF